MAMNFPAVLIALFSICVVLLAVLAVKCHLVRREEQNIRDEMELRRTVATAVHGRDAGGGSIVVVVVVEGGSGVKEWHMSDWV